MLIGEYLSPKQNLNSTVYYNISHYARVLVQCIYSEKVLNVSTFITCSSLVLTTACDKSLLYYKGPISRCKITTLYIKLEQASLDTDRKIHQIQWQKEKLFTE